MSGNAYFFASLAHLYYNIKQIYGFIVYMVSKRDCHVVTSVEARRMLYLRIMIIITVDGGRLL